MVATLTMPTWGQFAQLENDFNAVLSEVNYSWQNADALRVELAKAKADTEFYQGLHATQRDSIMSLYAKLDEAEAARDEATARATHAEEELAGANWRAEDNLRCCEVRDATIDALEGELEVAKAGYQHESRRADAFGKALTIAEGQCRDMEERATNAEYNARHYWRELQAETNKARMYRQERDWERRRYDEAMRPTLTFNTHVVGNAGIGG